MKERHSRAHLGRIEHQGRTWVISCKEGMFRFHALGGHYQDPELTFEVPLEVMFRRSLKQLELFA